LMIDGYDAGALLLLEIPDVITLNEAQLAP
jgi:hypothetical protein